METTLQSPAINDAQIPLETLAQTAPSIALSNAQKRMTEIRAQHSQSRQKALSKASKIVPEKPPQLVKKSPYDIFINLFFVHFSTGYVFGGYVRDSILAVPPKNIDVFAPMSDANAETYLPSKLQEFIKYFNMHDQLISWKRQQDNIFNSKKVYYEMLLEIHNVPVFVNFFTSSPDNPEFTCNMLKLDAEGKISSYYIPEDMYDTCQQIGHIRNVTMIAMQHIHMGLLVPLKANYDKDDPNDDEDEDEDEDEDFEYDEYLTDAEMGIHEPEHGPEHVPEHGLHHSVPDHSSVPLPSMQELGIIMELTWTQPAQVPPNELAPEFSYKIPDHILRQKNIRLINRAIKMISRGWYLMPDIHGKRMDVDIFRIVPTFPNIRPAYIQHLLNTYKDIASNTSSQPHPSMIYPVLFRNTIPPLSQPDVAGQGTNSNRETIPTWTSIMSNESFEDLCPCCQESFNEVGTSIRLKCGHAFHMTCIYKQMMQLGPNASQCALCRNSV
eukprot:Pompholyxophrys_sp_v1_NODE_1_length_32789_cov_6.460653.p3 type:complete len:497 gc:universal NODE_1_length_32789_cov_6.460653:13145-14635(+)